MPFKLRDTLIMIRWDIHFYLFIFIFEWIIWCMKCQIDSITNSYGLFWPTNGKKKIQKGNIRNIFINKYQLSWLIKRSLMTYEYVKLSCLSIVNFRLFSQNEPSLHFIPTFIDESCVRIFDSAFLHPRLRCSRESVENDVCGNEWVTV